MENQCKELEKQGQTYPDLLEQMRQKMDAELEAYKRDCEDTHRRNVSRDTAKARKMTCAPIEDSDQPVHARAV